MDVRFTEEQNLLRESARDFLAKECPMEHVRAMMDDPRGMTDALWTQLAEMGWLGLAFPEENGGSGLDLVDLAVVLEEMGRVLLPEPFLSSVVLGQALVLAGDDHQRELVVRGIAEGRLRLALAQLEESASWDAPGIALRAAPTGDGFTLDGVKHFAADAQVADLLLVPVRVDRGGPEDVTLLLVETETAGISVRPVSYVDATRKVCEVRFDRVAVERAAVLGGVGGGWDVLQRILDVGRIAVAAEACGGAQRVLEQALDHARVREQFGKPIGSFQAIQHKCADMLVLVESAKSATYQAAWTLAQGEPDAHVTACLAKAYASEAYVKVACEGIQIHGGQGFTWEQDLHLYFKRAKASELLFGSPSFLRELAARVVLDGAA